MRRTGGNGVSGAWYGDSAQRYRAAAEGTAKRTASVRSSSPVWMGSGAVLWGSAKRNSGLVQADISPTGRNEETHCAHPLQPLTPSPPHRHRRAAPGAGAAGPPRGSRDDGGAAQGHHRRGVRRPDRRPGGPAALGGGGTHLRRSGAVLAGAAASRPWTPGATAPGRTGRDHRGRSASLPPRPWQDGTARAGAVDGGGARAGPVLPRLRNAFLSPHCKPRRSVPWLFNMRNPGACFKNGLTVGGG